MKFRIRFPVISYFCLILIFTVIGCGGGSDQSRTRVNAPTEEVTKQESPALRDAFKQEDTASAELLRPEDPLPEAPEMEVTGKIVFNRAAGGYYINGEDPAGRFIIVNQDPKLLAELQERGQPVKIQGRLTAGVSYLYIDRIDRDSYSGTQGPKFGR